MSSQEDNTNNKKLKEFLNKSKISDNSSMDDFEKEALEGFAMLDNEEEALNLKSSLDTKIYKEVFAEEKKSTRVIWYAAAGLFLLIGFSVYFIRNNSFSNSEGLAIHSPAPIVNEIQKSLEDPDKKNEVPAQEPVTAQKSDETEKETYKQIKPGKAEKASSVQNSDAKDLSAGTLAFEPKPQAAPPAMQMQEKEEMMQPNVATGAASSGTSKDLAQDDLEKFSIPSTKSEEKMYVTEVQKAKTSESKKRSKNEEHTIATNARSSVAGPAVVTYPGGNETLAKDLKNLLSSKNLSQKFDATLFIDENRKVEKVIFTNTYDLNKEQQKEITQILKQLKNFNITGSSEKNLAEYKLIYRP